MFLKPRSCPKPAESSRLNSMKTTVEIPEKTLKRAKTLAAAKGLSLEQLVAEAIEDKIGRGEELGKGEPRWMKLYGAFAKSEDMRTDTRSIQKIIDEEFERIDPGDWNDPRYQRRFRFRRRKPTPAQLPSAISHRYPSPRYRVRRISLRDEVLPSSGFNDLNEAQRLNGLNVLNGSFSSGRPADSGERSLDCCFGEAARTADSHKRCALRSSVWT